MRYAACAVAVFLILLCVPAVPVILVYGATAPAWLVIPLTLWGFLSVAVALVTAGLVEGR